MAPAIGIASRPNRYGVALYRYSVAFYRYGVAPPLQKPPPDKAFRAVWWSLSSSIFFYISIPCGKKSAQAQPGRGAPLRGSPAFGGPPSRENATLRAPLMEGGCLPPACAFGASPDAYAARSGASPRSPKGGASRPVFFALRAMFVCKKNPERRNFWPSLNAWFISR